jgi:hypothetical protein
LETKEAVNDVIHTHEKKGVRCGVVIFYKSFLLTWSVSLKEEYNVDLDQMLGRMLGYHSQGAGGRSRRQHAEQCQLRIVAK